MTEFPEFGVETGNGIKFEVNECEFLSMNGLPIRVTNIKILINDDIIIKGNYEPFAQLKSKYETINLISDNGWKIEIKKFAIKHNDHTGGVFEGIAISCTAKEGNISSDDEVKAYILTEDINFDCPNPTTFESEKLDDLKLYTNTNDNFSSSTGYFLIEDSYESLEYYWDYALKNIYFLLSLFSSNFANIRIYYIKNQNNDKEIRVSLKQKDYITGNSIFYMTYPNEIKKFLNSTYDNYVELNYNLNLKTLIHYFVLMKNAKYIDSHRYLMGSIFFEALKYSYATNVKEYEKVGSGFKDVQTGKIYYFKDLIYKILNQYRINIEQMQNNYINYYYGVNLSDFPLFHVQIPQFVINHIKNYRNEVVHEGNIKINFEENSKQMSYLEWTIELLLIKILKINCYYWADYFNEWTETKRL